MSFVSYCTHLSSHCDFTTVTIFLVVMYVTWKFYNGYNLPPGPWGLPFVGYLLFMGSKPAEETFKELSKKYGNIISVYFGSRLVVVLNNYELIKEAYVKQGENFSGRPQGSFFKIDEEQSGLIIEDGESWRDNRRFVLSTLRDYGMGKLSLEPKIMEEVHYFLEEVAKEKEQPFDLADVLGMSTANIIATLEFGKRFDYQDERFLQIRKMHDEALDLLTNKNILPFFPWLAKIPCTDSLTQMKRIRAIDNAMKRFANDMIDEHKAKYTSNSKKDLIDAYLTEQHTMIQSTGSEGNFTSNELEGILKELFGAGSGTTTVTIRWGLLFMMIHPEIQKKVQKEIDDVIGMERQPSMSDRLRMVYTDAVLTEIQRYGAIVPLNIPHSNIEETTLGGYWLPKRSVIFTNLWAVSHDPDLWNQPEKFMPERFINKEGKIEKPEFLLPFGIGKRACVGESLAKMELFLYFTSLLQRFTFEPPKGETPLLDIESGMARRPKPFKLRAIQRLGYSIL